ncbi:putative HTH-type transcriptional regulator cbbR (RuBisCO operon transcriptional regulator) [Bradyrhizobium sp. ORS 375]|uniref:LysR family transcriptional regulator n=1 Tax=Bradyrhizobium sp. (strain ORS 375) TaxID=566679 RepID=UPI0002406E54|nr:LysR family transcriptional regulator [Bradyrhizobium sp. ORS 375]CCD90772.1 putative HTH-type transcriptional regulator cbbR (RuBisCO operon transcriptional regulator) [Bradyrhizobium sp. ORS 375]
MTFEQMRIFLEAAHFGSFTHAAERLGLTQSAVSVSIKKLEEKLDVPLFDRSGRRLMLTDAGQVLLNEAERILRDVELTMRRVEGRRPLAQSALVACTASAYDFWMPQMLARGGSGAHGVDLVRGGVNEVAAYVMRGTADAGVTSAMPSHPQFQQVAVFADRLVLCAHPDRAQRVPDDLGWKALGEQAPLLWEHGELTQMLVATLVSHRLEPERVAHPVLKLSSSTAVISALLGGRHIGFVSDRAAQPWISSGRLVRIGTLEIPVRYWLFGLREHNIDRFVSLFGGRGE